MCMDFGTVARQLKAASLQLNNNESVSNQIWETYVDTQQVDVVHGLSHKQVELDTDIANLAPQKPCSC